MVLALAPAGTTAPGWGQDTLCVVLPGHHSRTFWRRGEVNGVPCRSELNRPALAR